MIPSAVAVECCFSRVLHSRSSMWCSSLWWRQRFLLMPAFGMISWWPLLCSNSRQCASLIPQGTLSLLCFKNARILRGISVPCSVVRFIELRFREKYGLSYNTAVVAQKMWSKGSVPWVCTKMCFEQEIVPLALFRCLKIRCLTFAFIFDHENMTLECFCTSKALIRM